MKKVELLAPAGDLEKLKMAIIYGADAVYMGGEQFGLRAASKNFSDEDMIEGIKFAHERGKKVYVTCNIIPHNEDLNGAGEYFKKLEDFNVDALIISDPGFLLIAKEYVPNMEIHLSTQANTTNYQGAKFWHNQGIKRIVVARELSLEEIKELSEKTPKSLEIEAFIHGAMCMSYSGRCLISNYMTSRDANRGECAQPCRWNYSLVESTRPGEYFPVEEDERGTYFFNSKDLCLIEYIPELINSGITSLKIEGRIKTAYYVATVVRAYRKAIDSFYDDGENWIFKQDWLNELKKVSYRDFTTGFFQEKANYEAQNYGTSSYIRNYDFIGLVKDYNKEKNLTLVEQRNRFEVGEEIEIIGPDIEQVNIKILRLFDESMNSIEVSNIPKSLYWIEFDKEIEFQKEYILRRVANKVD